MVLEGVGEEVSDDSENWGDECLKVVVHLKGELDRKGPERRNDTRPYITVLNYIKNGVFFRRGKRTV